MLSNRLFTDDLTAAGQAKPVIFSNNRHRPLGDQVIIYHINNYSTLLGKLKTHKFDDEDVVESRTVRVCLSLSYELLFGREGSPSSLVPAHGQIGGRECLFAGNIGFDADNAIIILSNKSGDYQTPFNQLLYLIIAMRQQGMLFAESIYIRRLDNGKETSLIRMTRDELFKQVDELTANPKYQAIVTAAKSALSAVPPQPSVLTLPPPPSPSLKRLFSHTQSTGGEASDLLHSPDKKRGKVIAMTSFPASPSRPAVPMSPVPRPMYTPQAVPGFFMPQYNLPDIKPDSVRQDSIRSTGFTLPKPNFGP